MVAQKKTKSSKFLSVPTRPVPIDRDRSVAGLLEKMEGAGFGAKQLAEAHRIWLDMLDDNSTIYLCGSGNLITSGMRRLIAYVIKNRFVDVIVPLNVAYQLAERGMAAHIIILAAVDKKHADVSGRVNRLKQYAAKHIAVAARLIHSDAAHPIVVVTHVCHFLRKRCAF